LQITDSHEILILLRLGLAVLLGGVIGYDRERVHKPAGLRTHMLVSGAASFLISVGLLVEHQYLAALGDQVIRTDPIRVIGAIITGVTFLGAGTILRTREGDVEGLTTAATLLFAAVVGICVGAGGYFLAVVSTLLVVTILIFGVRIEKLLGIRN